MSLDVLELTSVDYKAGLKLTEIIHAFASSLLKKKKKVIHHHAQQACFLESVLIHTEMPLQN